MLKKLFLLLLVISLTQVSFAKRWRVKRAEPTTASASTTAKKVLVAVDLLYSQTAEAANYQLKNDFRASAEDPQWVTIQNEKADQPVVLLARVDKAEDKQVFLSFLVIATGSKPGLLAAPKMVLVYGQKGQLTINNGNRHLELQLNVMARR